MVAGDKMLTCCIDTCRPKHQQTALKKIKYDIDVAFLFPDRENRNVVFYTFSSRSQKSLTICGFARMVFQGRGFIFNLGKMAFYRITSS